MASITQGQSLNLAHSRFYRVFVQVTEYFSFVVAKRRLMLRECRLQLLDVRLNRIDSYVTAVHAFLLTMAAQDARVASISLLAVTAVLVSSHRKCLWESLSL